jgi:hypothetical protein
MKRNGRVTTQSMASQRGYAFVTALVIGSLVLMIALVAIARDQSDRSISGGFILEARSAALAEAAVATYQSFLLEYPALATYSDCENKNTATGECYDSGATQSWFRAENIRAAIGGCAGSPSLSDPQVNQIHDVAAKNWQNIALDDPADITQGQFRLVRYEYKPDTTGAGQPKTPGTGRFILEGRIEEGVSHQSQAKTIGGSATSRIELEFRVKPGPAKETSVGLWAEDFDISGLSGPKIQTNACDIGGLNEQSEVQPYLGNLPDDQPATVGYSSPVAPPLPAGGAAPFAPGPGVYNIIEPISLNNNEVCRLPMLGESQISTLDPSVLGSTKCLSPDSAPPPPLNETPTYDNSGRPIYRYNILKPISIDDNDGNEDGVDNDAQLILGKTGTETIVLYVQDDIILKRGGRISTQPGTRVIIYLQGSIKSEGKPPGEYPYGVFDVRSGKPEDFQIYAYSPKDIDLQDEQQVGGVIYAPEAQVKLLNGKFDGMIWAKHWTGKDNFEVQNTSINPQELQIKIPGPDRISPATSWRQSAVQ